MSLSFVTPWALILLGIIPILWIWAIYVRPASQSKLSLFALLLRSIIALALILAIAGIQIVRPVQGLTTVFVLDASDSVAPSQRERATQFVEQALSQMPAQDQGALVIFGENALVERAPSSQTQLARLSSIPVAARTNIEEALQLALALFPADSQKRIVLLSDGGENMGRAVEAARLAGVRNIPIDIVELLTERGPDVLISQLLPNAIAREGQQILMNVTLSSSFATSAALQIFVDGQLAGEQALTIEPGQHTVTFSLPAGNAGFRRVEVRLNADGDTQALNNRADALVEVQGPPHILLIAADAQRAANLQAALQAVHIRSTLLTPAQAPASLEQLGDYAAIMLVDTSMRDLPESLLIALPGYVEDLGRGLAMIGGVDSFGAGGYRRAPRDSAARSIEDVLPVNLDPLDTSLQPDLALVLVIDRSGSMVESGSSKRSKLDLAKEAVYQASLALTQHDQIGLVVFDETAQWMLPLQRLPGVDLIERALSFSVGGGTNIRPGIDQAARALATSQAKIKHVILLTDGLADSNYSDLINSMNAQGITISTVAIGADANPNLEQVAINGGGRFFKVEQAEDLPSIFLQETVIVAGRDILEQTITPVITLASPIVRGLSSLPQLYGYNGTEIKSATRVILSTPDSKPILAQGQYGLGRSVAWTSDMQGKWARDWVSWEQFPGFVAGLSELMLPPQNTGALSLHSTTDGARAQLEIQAQDAQGHPLDNLALQARFIDPDSQSSALRFTQIGPGRYQASAETGAPGIYLVQVAALGADGQAIGTMTGAVIASYSLEYAEQPSNPQLLRDIAALSGGRISPEPQTIFQPTTQNVGAITEIALPLLWLALILWPMDIAVRRLRLERAAIMQWMRQHIGRSSSTDTANRQAMARLNAAKQRATARNTAAPQQLDQNGPARESEQRRASRETAMPQVIVVPETAAVTHTEQPATPQSDTPPKAETSEERFARLMAAKNRARRGDREQR